MKKNTDLQDDRQLKEMEKQSKLYENKVKQIQYPDTSSNLLLHSNRNLSSINYNLIDVQQAPLLDRINAISFNNNNTKLIVGCFKSIKAIDFTQGQLILAQELVDENMTQVTLIQFLRKSNEFISADMWDTAIRLWSEDNNQKWFCLQRIITAHDLGIHCVIASYDENLMISCSSDKSIKFWIKFDSFNLWKCHQKLVLHEFNVKYLSLNQSENYLTSFGDDRTVCISCLGKDNRWRKKQRVILQDFGKGCFIEDQIFAFKPYIKDQLLLFSFDWAYQTFVKHNDFLIGTGDFNDQFSQMSFNIHKSFLICKINDQIHLIRIKQQSDQFPVNSCLKPTTYYFIWTISYDGDYIAIFNDVENEFKKFQYQNQCN